MRHVPERVYGHCDQLRGQRYHEVVSVYMPEVIGGSMGWVKLDDGFPEHPKVAAMSDAALALWVTGLAYCNRNLTDGFIPEAVGRGQLRYCDGDSASAIHELERVGSWVAVERGWQVHDYHDFQPSRAAVLAEREATRLRVERHRNGRRNAVTNTDVPGTGTGGLALGVGVSKQGIRESDLLFEAVAEVCGMDLQALTRSARGQLNRAVGELRGVDASPEEVRIRAGRWVRLFDPDTTLTPTALAKHWPALAKERRGHDVGASMLARAAAMREEDAR